MITYSDYSKDKHVVLGRCIGIYYDRNYGELCILRYKVNEEPTYPQKYNGYIFRVKSIKSQEYVGNRSYSPPAY